ncbi:uncharacterized protein LOC114208207 [Eumetopias jubatus]|uniref:uncharacterized protein LOC114208207 n=1 Tax=Eumetopias jubatus TaxID=34886 RepID=UPI001016001B|nr:uncharacterized protein LOC114208207 [Eumetopias jubatus]
MTNSKRFKFHLRCSCTRQCGILSIMAHDFPSLVTSVPLLRNCQLSTSVPEKRERGRRGNMSMLLLLLSGILFAFLFVFWKSHFQSSVGEMSSNSTSPALVRPTSFTGSTKSDTDKSLSVISLSWDILINSPHTITMQKQILVNLRIMEYKLAELEHFLVIKGLNGTLVNWKSEGLENVMTVEAIIKGTLSELKKKISYEVEKSRFGGCLTLVKSYSSVFSGIHRMSEKSPKRS